MRMRDVRLAGPTLLIGLLAACSSAGTAASLDAATVVPGDPDASTSADATIDPEAADAAVVVDAAIAEADAFTPPPAPPAATPPMGWNSWNHFGCDVSEDLIKQMADA